MSVKCKTFAIRIRSLKCKELTNVNASFLPPFLLFESAEVRSTGMELRATSSLTFTEFSRRRDIMPCGRWALSSKGDVPDPVL